MFVSARNWGISSLDHVTSFFLFFFFLIFIYFLAVLSLRCHVQLFFSSCGEQGLLFIVVHEVLIVVASLVVEHGL